MTRTDEALSRGLIAGIAAAALAIGACSGGGGSRAPEVPPAPPPPSRAGSPLAMIDLAIRRYANDRAGRLPATLSDLVRESPPEGGRYLREVPLDPWGRPYSYAVTDPRSGSYDLRSYGPDTLPGTPDDLVSRARPVLAGAPDSP